MNEKRVDRMLREVRTYPMPGLVSAMAMALADGRFNGPLAGLGAAVMLAAVIAPTAGAYLLG